MSSSIFSLDIAGKTLTRLQPKAMTDLGLTEPYDLEAWLASSSGGLFNRQVLWLARQDRPSEEQRSDLIGVDKQGDLLITELKRGCLAEDAVTQALAYAAEYARTSAEELATLFSAHSAKVGTTGLVAKASSFDDALAQLSAHVGTGTEVNESQILLLVGEDFTAKALAVCDYLNNASGEASFSIECWRYSIHQTAEKSSYFVLEQVLPPPSVRQAIDEKREASKARKYARDPIKMVFMEGLITYLRNKKVNASRSKGQSYEFRIISPDWNEDHWLAFSVHTERPRLVLPTGLYFQGNLSDYNLMEGTNWDGRRTLEFTDIHAGDEEFAVFGDRLIKVIGHLKVTPSEGSTAQPAGGGPQSSGGAA